jgi:phosphatidate phosphatase APP1
MSNLTKKDVVRQISQVTSTADSYIDNVRLAIAKVLGIEDPICILPYRGYGTPEKFMFKGRVVKDEGVKIKEKEPSITNNLWNMYKRFATDEVESARLRIQFDTTEKEVTADKEGYFYVEVHPESEDRDWDFWCPVEVSLIEPKAQKNAVLEKGEVLIVPDHAAFGVISDIDDTIVHTAATDLLKMIRIVYLGSAESRQPFEGVAEFYSALQSDHQNQPYNPIFYVSSSAWNMYDVLAQFMELNHIPKGPIFMKDIELSLENLLSFTHEAHKFEQIEPIFERFPDLPFLLIGDSGQKDPEIYHSLLQKYPHQVLGILIRDAVPNDGWRKQELQEIADQVRAAGSHFCLFQDTSEAMEFAVEQGWIPAASECPTA